ncbi:transposon Tf2-11 polyprotein [Trichonephila clavipes]|nr:transposon Tf2-11 polyprotein [Trichonephila clavipes]
MHPIWPFREFADAIWPLQCLINISTFLLTRVTRDLPFVYAFVDDLLVASDNEPQHLEHLEILFSKLKEYGLCINVEKCQFGQSTIEFLGFKLSGEGIEPLPDRVKCILEFPQPTTLTQLRRYLEGRTFVIYTDQKPLTYAFQQHSEKCSPRQLRHLDFISQFSTDIRYTKGSDNTVADALSRIGIDEISPTVINFKEFASLCSIG